MGFTICSVNDILRLYTIDLSEEKLAILKEKSCELLPKTKTIPGNDTNFVYQLKHGWLIRDTEGNTPSPAIRQIPQNKCFQTQTTYFLPSEFPHLWTLMGAMDLNDIDRKWTLNLKICVSCLCIMTPRSGTNMVMKCQGPLITSLS